MRGGRRNFMKRFNTSWRAWIPAVIPLGVYDVAAKKGNWVGVAKAVRLDLGKVIHFVPTVELRLDDSPKPAPARPRGRGIHRGDRAVGG